MDEKYIIFTPQCYPSTNIFVIHTDDDEYKLRESQVLIPTSAVQGNKYRWFLTEGYAKDKINLVYDFVRGTCDGFELSMITVTLLV